MNGCIFVWRRTSCYSQCMKPLALLRIYTCREAATLLAVLVYVSQLLVGSNRYSNLTSNSVMLNEAQAAQQLLVWCNTMAYTLRDNTHYKSVNDGIWQYCGYNTETCDIAHMYVQCTFPKTVDIVPWLSDCGMQECNELSLRESYEKFMEKHPQGGGVAQVIISD